MTSRFDLGVASEYTTTTSFYVAIKVRVCLWETASQPFDQVISHPVHTAFFNPLSDPSGICNIERGKQRDMTVRCSNPKLVHESPC